MNKEYDIPFVCKKCMDKNITTVISIVSGTVLEYSTLCTVCGYESYWAYGYYQSEPPQEKENE